MPVNSFDDYPMSWKPKKELLTAPKYRALADLLADDILTGKLPPHTKLPPQRELADYLDLNFSTVTRAFQHYTQKGLIYGITGEVPSHPLMLPLTLPLPMKKKKHLISKWASSSPWTLLIQKPSLSWSRYSEEAVFLFWITVTPWELLIKEPLLKNSWRIFP